MPGLGDLLLALVYGLFVRVSIGAAIQGDIGAFMLAIQEFSIVVLVLIRRRARQSAATGTDAIILAWLGTILPLLLRPHQSSVTVVALLGGAIQLAGGLLALVATVRLGRSFGVVVANRGVQTGGLYRYVRHPIYAAYLLAFGGFVLAHPSDANGLILAVWFVVQLLRIRAEEHLLLADPGYQAYTARVRYRLLPGVW